MLTPEQAQAILKEIRLADSGVREAAAIKTLTETQRTALHGFFYRKADGSTFPTDQYGSLVPEAHQTHIEAVNFLAAATVDRLAIFTVLFPTIAPHVEAAWQLLATLPYRSGYTRRAFRAPTRPEYYTQVRANFINRAYKFTRGYHQDIRWFAEYAVYLGEGYAADCFSTLLAAAINGGGADGQAVFDILIASANGEHEIGAMGRHITRALLIADRPDGWDYIERLLLAAQRQEGLRQVVLEAVDESHPEAFRRMLHLILDHDLLRFSAVTRAFNVWGMYNYDSQSAVVIGKLIAAMVNLLEDADARAEALRVGDGAAVYLALFATAYIDVMAAIPLAESLLMTDPNVDRRYAAARLLQMIGLQDTTPILLKALHDPDLRVAQMARTGLQGQLHKDNLYLPVDAFEQIEAAIPQFPERLKTLEPLVWEWLTLTANRGQLISLLLHILGDRPPTRLIPYWDDMWDYDRSTALQLLVKHNFSDPQIRDLALKSLGNRSEYLRREALNLFAKEEFTAPEAEYLESLLTRKAADLRRGMITLLLRQPDDAVLASADRLTAARPFEQRAAGLELLVELNKAKRSPAEVKIRASAYRSARADALTDAERVLIEQIEAEEAVILTLRNGLGLYNPADRTKAPAPLPHDVKIETPAAVALLLSLDALIHEHRQDPYPMTTWQGEQEKLLGDAVFPQTDVNAAIAEDSQRLPLTDLWKTWAEARPADQRDADGLEFARAYLLMIRHAWEWGVTRGYRLPGSPAPEVKSSLTLRYMNPLTALTGWLMRLYPVDGTADFLLDALENEWATVAAVEPQNTGNSHFRGDSTLADRLIQPAIWHIYMRDVTWTGGQIGRLWGLFRWLTERRGGREVRNLKIDFVMRAYRAGVANVADVYGELLYTDNPESPYQQLTMFRDLTGRKPPPIMQEYDTLRIAVERIRERIVEIELRRGEQPSEVTGCINAIRSLPGANWFVRLLSGLSHRDLERKSRWGNSRPEVFSRLISVTYPASSDTPKAFAKALKDARIGNAPISEKLLVQTALLAPQWADWIEPVIGWKGFADAVWWLHAHTKDAHWFVDSDLRDEWNAAISRRTPLTGADLMEGGVDVDWFHSAYKTVGAEHWKKLYDAAKYATGGVGHTRAKLFADALLGNLEESAMTERILKKRHGDSARALGLLPLAKAKKTREAEVLRRYQTLQEFLRTSRKFGAQRRASESRAVEIGIDNLARSAGYADPVRLQWAMEAREAADLKDGVLSATRDDVTMTLTLDVVGKPEIAIMRGGKKLKALPAKYKKDEAFVALRERRTQISRQFSRMRLSLENAMIREDAFTGAELRDLFNHPLLKPMLEQLVFVQTDAPLVVPTPAIGGVKRLIGFPVDNGTGLIGYDGAVTPLPAAAVLKIAHPVDLYQTEEWEKWQRDCFVNERIQPFKQVFRELYLLTDTERAEKTISRRYAGHQIQPRQAMALFGVRGWVSDPEGGTTKTFHHLKLTAAVGYMYGYGTPAEVEGATLEGVLFYQKGKWTPAPLEEVPAITFSEVMRDLDLVVSVAHRGGVDPEATASTTDMRAALIRETCRLLKVGNVAFKGNHALIEGKLGSYSVHLGSANVHRQPGGFLFIIPVHAQHRGRIFLPFADDDPKTAEVISKVILLAQDAQIKDPTILEQIMSRG